MEKNEKYTLITFLSVLFLSICLICIFTHLILKNYDSSIYEANQNEYYSEVISTEIPQNSKILTDKDTHGGFLGDGDTYAVIQINKDDVNTFLENAEKSSKWKSLPLIEDLEIIIYGIEYEEDDTSYSYGPYCDYDIPKIKNGIYYFRDRYAEQYPDEVDVNINDRGTYNLTIAMFDYDTNKLYIYELDT